MNSHRRVTITDVAKRAGVSKVTVSYVLNGQSETARISAATQQKVTLAAAELGYTPSAIARSMVTGKSETIGVIFQDALYFAAKSDFILEVMNAVNKAAVDHAHDILLHTKPAINALAEASMLTDGRVDGVLILRNKDDETINLLINKNFPCVLFFTRTELPGVPYVDGDNIGGARQAVDHLIELGHKRIALIAAHEKSTSSGERIQGYKESLSCAGIDFDERLVLHVTPGHEIRDIKKLLSERRPTAVFCFSDEFAFYTMHTARELGLHVPTDLSVVGFDSLDSSEKSDPPLTSVRQPVHEIAQQATKLLVALTKGEKPKDTQIILPTELDIRQSTCPPRA